MPTPLPEWPLRTIAFFVTVDENPHVIPVSAPVRAGDHTILLSLHRTRDSLARLRERPQVALALLSEGNVAFTARGFARVVDEPMTDAPDYAAVEIDVADVDDHRQPAFTVEAGVERRWIDEDEKRALGKRIDTLRRLAATRGQRSATGRPWRRA
jgi:Pyridoxamine 5'-phosphate oxidase